MTAAELPPRPDGTPTQGDYVKSMLAHAELAAQFAELPKPGWRSAEQEFFRSWRSMARGIAADVEESAHRALAWDRAEEAEAKLEQIREIVADEMTDFPVARIREVLDQ